jgi:hypothetical protein
MLLCRGALCHGYMGHRGSTLAVVHHNAEVCLRHDPLVVSRTACNTPQISRPSPLAYVESIFGLKTIHILCQSFPHNIAFGAYPLWSLEEPL